MYFNIAIHCELYEHVKQLCAMCVVKTLVVDLPFAYMSIAIVFGMLNVRCCAFVDICYVCLFFCCHAQSAHILFVHVLSAYCLSAYFYFV